MSTTKHTFTTQKHEKQHTSFGWARKYNFERGLRVYLRCLTSRSIGPILQEQSNKTIKMQDHKWSKRKVAKTKTYMVWKPLMPLLKNGETERSIFFQLNVFSPRESLLGLRVPKTPSNEEMNIFSVIPSVECDLTEDTNVVARSNNVSASAICSLGCLTNNQTQQWIS